MHDSVEDRLGTWIGMWNEQLAHVDDVALAVEKLVAEGLSVSHFASLPRSVKQQVLHDLDTFTHEGRRTYYIAHTAGEEIDDSELMRSVAASFAAAGIWSPEMLANMGPPEQKWGPDAQS